MSKRPLAACLCLVSLACSSGAKTPASGGTGGDEETGGKPGTGGAVATGGKQGGGTGGAPGTGGSSPGTGGSMEGTGGSAVPPDAGIAKDVGVTPDPNQPKFSFFVTSMAAMQRLAKSEKGFGG